MKFNQILPTCQPSPQQRLGIPIGPEAIYSIPKAAELLGIKPFALRRAVAIGLVPYHLPFGRRKYVRLSEVITAIASFQSGED